MAKLAPKRLTSIACALALACTAAPAQTGLFDALKQILPLPGQAKPGAALAPAAAAAAAALPIKVSPDIAGELKPDTNCSRPAEKFDVAEKLAHYGGQAASLRLAQLVASDFAYSSLTPQDRQMLQYLAQTTVWLPPELESRLRSLYDLGGGLFNFNKNTLTDEQLLAQAEIKKRLDELRALVPDYPIDLELAVDKGLPDGAFARFGGVILLSENFLNALEDAGEGAYFLLAHEMSHIYKRHAVKLIQYRLISSSEGWDLARPLLRRVQRGAGIDPIEDGMLLFTTAPLLIDFIRNTQITFGQHQELEADACSVVWLQRLKHEPTAAWHAYMAKLGAHAAYAAEHPSSAEREKRFVAKARGKDLDRLASPDKGTVKALGQTLVPNPVKKKK
jgi:Zn-dependent protease with chaperone function